MGKLGKRKRQLERDNNVKAVESSICAVELDDLVDHSSFCTTLHTLQVLATQPALLKSPACKPLRAAAHALHKASNSLEGGLTSRVTSALGDARWLDARCLLAEMQIREEVPMLGALQRWVRECDAANTLEEQRGKTRYQREEVWRVLEAVLRTVENGARIPGNDAVSRYHAPINKTIAGVPIREAAWKVGAPTGGSTFLDWHSGSLSTLREAIGLRKTFSLLHTTPGPDRKPANLHPAFLHTCPPGTIPFVPSSDPVVRHLSPFHVSVFLLTNVLPVSTCRSIVASASAVGFTPDQPSAGAAAVQASILAHNFYWIADTRFLTTLFERVRPFLPPGYADGARLYGINARFRCYRYVPGAVYRPHIDGAWPPSAINAKSGEYIYDASPPGEKVLSRLTFLIYLNDEFEGGETTFFLPKKDSVGLSAWPVEPRCGGILVFPHGEGGEGGLLHEGSAVTLGGKFVIRTDVLYAVTKS